MPLIATLPGQYVTQLHTDLTLLGFLLLERSLAFSLLILLFVPLRYVEYLAHALRHIGLRYLWVCVLLVGDGLLR